MYFGGNCIMIFTVSVNIPNHHTSIGQGKSNFKDCNIWPRILKVRLAPTECIHKASELNNLSDEYEPVNFIREECKESRHYFLFKTRAHFAERLNLKVIFLRLVIVLVIFFRELFIFFRNNLCCKASNIGF